MSNPKISIIIPVYNVEKYLSECLDSIVNQTLKEIEIICINDGSTDNSLSILKEYASKDERIKIIDKENEGQGYARKVGLDIARGEYILFCDSDDKYVSNEVFDELYNEIKNNNSELMFFNFYRGKANKGYDLNINEPVKISRNIFGLSFAPWFKIYKKSFFDRYDNWCFPKYLKFQDMPFHIQSCLRTDFISYFDKICYFYRTDNQTNITNSQRGKKHIENICDIILLNYKILEEEKVLEKYNLEFSFLVVTQIRNYFIQTNKRTDLVSKIKNTFEKINCMIDNAIKTYSPNTSLNFPYLNRQHILFYKLFIRLNLENLCKYIENKKQKELMFLKKQLQSKNEAINRRDEALKNKDSAIKQKDSEIQNLRIQNNDLRTQNNIQDQAIKRLQNSWSYRIGHLFTYPLSIPFEFVKYIRDYNLIKKSNLFDSEYYLANNEDVKKAKVDPIKHYLKFGWKEGRNPSTDFDGNEYLNKRLDVQVAGICPLVHYLKFRKDEK